MLLCHDAHMLGAERVDSCRWVPGLPGLDKVARTVDSPTAMINYLRTLPADEVRPMASLQQHASWALACTKATYVASAFDQMGYNVYVLAAAACADHLPAMYAIDSAYRMQWAPPHQDPMEALERHAPQPPPPHR